MKSVLFLIVGVCVLAGCSDADGARRVLAAQGYKDVQITGWRAFGCDEKDAFHTGFKALGSNGAPVSGVVCAGWLKGVTVRFD